MRVIVLFSFAFLAATAAIFSSASNAATFAECKRAAVISNWPQLIEELGKDEFDAVIRSCAATPKASPKAGIPYRDAEITSISGLPTGGQKVSHRTGRLLKFDVRARAHRSTSRIVNAFFMKRVKRPNMPTSIPSAMCAIRRSQYWAAGKRRGKADRLHFANLSLPGQSRLFSVTGDSTTVAAKSSGGPRQ